MKIFNFLLPLCLHCFLVHAQEPLVTTSRQIPALLESLEKAGVLSLEEEWVSSLTTQNPCPGNKVAPLLMQLARSFKPVETLNGAIQILGVRHIIKHPSYWHKNSLAEGSYSSNVLEGLLKSMVEYLPIDLPCPTSADAKPIQPSLITDLAPSYDLIIAGAGTGGCGAAIQAARMGCSVLLLEETDWIGGQMTAAGVTTMDEGSALVQERGLYREFCGNLAHYYKQFGVSAVYPYGRYCAEPCIAQKILRCMLGDSKRISRIDLLFCTQVKQVIKEGNCVVGVEIEIQSKETPILRTIPCRILVDATEWGDVIPLTGAGYRTGNCTHHTVDPTKHIQALTWTATIKHYPEGIPNSLRLSKPPPGYPLVLKRFIKGLHLGEAEDFYKEKPWSWQRFIGYRALPNSRSTEDSRITTRTQLNFNNDVHITVADIEDLTKRRESSYKALQKTLNLLYYIQNHLGMKDWTIANDEGYDTPYQRLQIDNMIVEHPKLKPFRSILYHFSVMPYVRESRRIIGLHTLKASEIERKPRRPMQFPHTLVLGDYVIDLHGSKIPRYLELDLDRLEDIPYTFGQKGMGAFAIPFECFIPEKIDGFLPAEKNISQSRMVSGATRLQPHTMLMGQAVGAIAALSIHQGIQPRALNPRLVQEALLDAGCPLSIEPLKSAWGTPEWKQENLDALDPKKL